jgi:hypothetical protein
VHLPVEVLGGTVRQEQLVAVEREAPLDRGLEVVADAGGGAPHEVVEHVAGVKAVDPAEVLVLSLGHEPSARRRRSRPAARRRARAAPG